MLKSQYRAADEWLSELVSEVAGTIGGFDQNLLGCLVEPVANGKNVLPVAGNFRYLCRLCVLRVFLQSRVSSHIHGCSGNGP